MFFYIYSSQNKKMKFIRDSSAILLNIKQIIVRFYLLYIRGVDEFQLIDVNAYYNSSQEFTSRGNAILSKCQQLSFNKLFDYLFNRWLLPAFDNWQPFHTRPFESFNKQLRETLTIYKLKCLYFVYLITE